MKRQYSSWKNRCSRSLYFLLDRLQVNRSERIAVSALAVLLVGLSLLNLFTRRQPVYEPSEYAKLERLFREKAAAAAARQEAILVRYEGMVPASGSLSAPGDTVADSLARTGGHSGTDTLSGAADPPEGAGVSVTTATPDSAGNSGSELQKVNINTADAETLQLLPGIGPAYSERIVNWRMRNGPFTSAEQLLEINGIGPVRLRRLRPLIQF